MAPRVDRGFPSRLGRLRPTLGRSLWVKITIASAILVLPLSGVFWYHSRKSERRLLIEGAASFAASFADLVRKSIREDMLRNDRDGVQRTVSSISSSESLRAVRIYDRFGTVAFSSSSVDVGRRVRRDDEPCVGCHEDPQRPRDTLHTDRRSVVFEGPEGGRVLSYIEPIYNEHACATDACHAHADGARVLGILIAEFPLTRIDQRMERQMRNFSAFVVFYLVALAVCGYLIVWLLVLVPVNAVSEAVERVAAGDLAQTVPVVSGDELGRLAANFNAMTMELAASRRRMERLTQGLEKQLGAKAAEVRRSEGRLAEAERFAALGRLTAEIAHEIRNPLTALGGYGRRLLRTVSQEGERECARIVVEEAARLEHLLKDVLDFSRPPRYALAPHRLEGIVRDSLAAFGERCRERGISVESELVAEELVCIDPAQVRRAVDNLVANAIDAMPDGGTLRVGTRLAAARCLTFVVIQVEDSGPGIPEEDILRMFEPFWTTKKKGEGTGLGLPITRKILEAHGGFVDVVNRPGGGLSASLWFPKADAVPPGRPCWEAIHCGRDGADSPEPCPAWPHFGRACWAVAGTFGDGPPRCTMAARIGDCRECSFYKVTAEG
jgi:signal transduction histidine kinase